MNQIGAYRKDLSQATGVAGATLANVCFRPIADISAHRILSGMDDQTVEQGTYRTPSNAEAALILLLCVPVYLFFANFEDQPFRGFVAGLSAGVVMSLISLLWPLRERPAFWICLTIVAVVHAALVYWLPFTGNFRFGFALFPLVLADIYLSARAIVFLTGARIVD